MSETNIEAGDVYVVHDHADWKMPGPERHFLVLESHTTGADGSGYAKVCIGRWDGATFTPMAYGDNKHYFVALVSRRPSEGSERIATIQVDSLLQR